MTTEGYLDRLFVSAQHQRQGIAQALVDKLKSDARESGLAEITTEASLTAQPFFETCGFVNVCKQTVERRGVEFVNYRMVFMCES